MGVKKLKIFDGSGRILARKKKNGQVFTEK
jgi:hypothetical protein